MKGKIFPESTNIFQDQAKILFDYYQSAAERIVQQEEKLEKEISKLKEENMLLEKERSKAAMLKWLLGILIIPFIIFMLKENKLKKQIGELDSRINEFNKMHREIFRDYKVTRMGIAYVPVADQIEYETKSFIVDYSGVVPESEVKLQLSRQNDLLIESITDLEKLSAEAPLVETSEEVEEVDTETLSKSMQQVNQHDYFGKLERTLRTISYCMDDLDISSVSLPLVANDSSYLGFLREYSTNEVPTSAPVFQVFDTNKYQGEVAKFQSINKLKDSLSRDTAQFEDVLKGLMMTMANSVQAISALKLASTDKVVFESNKVLYKILKAPYNHYSPVLEAQEIERISSENFNYSDSVQDYVPFNLKDSSRVKYNLVSDLWTAEDGSTTSFPFGIHQIHEEIVAPIVQNLMRETSVERMNIYNHIKDQKISYLNKWHQDTEDFYGRNRAESADLINLMRASLRDYVAAYNTLSSLKKTEESMDQSNGSLDATVVKTGDNSAEVFAAFELQSKEFQNVQLDFEAFMDRLKEDIDVKASKFEHIDYFDAMLRDGNAKETAIAGSEANQLEERRKPLVTVNPLFAKVSEIPPAPSVEDVVYDYVSINLPGLAKNSLNDLESELSGDSSQNIGVSETESQPEDPTDEIAGPAIDMTANDMTADSAPEASSILEGETDLVLDGEIQENAGEAVEDLDMEHTEEEDNAEFEIEDEEDVEDEIEDDGEEDESEDEDEDKDEDEDDESEQGR